MPKLISSMIQEARGHLQDTRLPYRYSESDLLQYIQTAYEQIRRKRPDLFVGQFFTDLPTLAVGDVFPLSTDYALAAVYFAVGSAMLRDDEFAVDARAVTMLRMYSDQLHRASA
jgi:hypothetical protein